MGSKIYTGLEPGGVYYIFCIGLDTLRIICVPLFLMLSGTLLLGKTESIFFIIKKRISRIFIVLIVFSFIQYWWQIRTLESEISGSEFIYLFYTGNIRGTYWYLYCYLAYLLLLPMLRNIASFMNRKIFIYIIIISTFSDVLGLIAYEFSDLYCSFYGYINIINGYAFLYPLLGYGAYKYLQEKQLSWKEYIVLIILFTITLCGCSWLVYHEYVTKGVYSEAHIWRFTALLVVPVYMIIYDKVRRKHISDHFAKLLATISNSCFGIYLCENFLEMYTLKIYNYVINICNIKLLACIIYIFCTILLGTAIFSIVKRIPLVAKFL